MTQINQHEKEFIDLPDTANLIAQDATGITGKVSKANLLKNLSTSGGNTGGGTVNPLAAWMIKSNDYSLADGERVIADTTSKMINLTLPSTGSVAIRRIGSNKVKLNIQKFQGFEVSGLDLVNEFEVIELDYINNIIGWIPSRTNLLKPLLNTAKYWRVNNTSLPGGSDRQWFCTELAFKDVNGNDLTNNGQGYVNNTANSAVFDKSPSFNPSQNIITQNGYGSIKYVFVEPVTVAQVSITNFNNGSNQPPSNYKVQSSPDNINWFDSWDFSIELNDGVTYTVTKP